MLCDDIRELTERALWETDNLLRCIPDTLWNARFDGIPMWKYAYHMLYSMDRWFINPCDPDYKSPPFHRPGLNDLNVVPGADETLPRDQAMAYFAQVADKLRAYAGTLTDDMLGETPPGCAMSRMKLILGQHRHWHRHMGVIYGFLIRETGRWPYVLNMDAPRPDTPMPCFYP